MVNLLRKFIGILLFVGTIGTTYFLVQTPDLIYQTVPSVVDNYPYITEQLLKSSRYTQKTEISEDRLDTFLNDYTYNFTKEELNTINFDLVLENENFELYFNDLSFAVMVRNKRSNYLWSSINMGFLNSDGNRTFRNHGNSGIFIDYVRTQNVMSSDITRTSILHQADARYYVNASTPIEDYPEDIPEKLQIYAFNPNSPDSDFRKAKITYTLSSNTINSSIEFKDLGFKFNVDITLNDNGLAAEIIKDSIVESNDQFRLLNIVLFPNLGSTREEKVPGYFMIPDGIGALVRLDRMYNKSFNARFFGDDFGYNQNYIADLKLPIFGITHLENEHAMLAEVIEGAEHTNLRAQFWGNTTKYNSMYAQYAVRNIYRTIISREGAGRDAILEGKLNGNFKISYQFLNDEEANYVGMARTYQKSLRDQGQLTVKENKDSHNIPMHFGYILSEQENAFIGSSKVTMSKTTNVEQMYNYFKDEGINNQQVTLYGWSNDGFVNRSPYRMNYVESEKNMMNLVYLIQKDDNKVYIHQNYKYATNLSSRVNIYSHVSYSISRVTMSYEAFDANNNPMTEYILYPHTSLSMATNDLKAVNKTGFDGLNLEGIGHNPFGYSVGNSYYDRTNTIDNYQKLASLYDNNLASNVSSYLFKYISGYIDLSISNAQYDYYTDLVPIIPIVLKGYISYYADYLNFNALGKDKFLSMIDFGINPSYVLTYEETYKMRFSQATNFYTTTYRNYQREIVDNYHYINEALKHVIGETIVNRVVLTTGVVEVSYSNGVKIYINYANKPYVLGSIEISAQDYEVIL